MYQVLNIFNLKLNDVAIISKSVISCNSQNYINLIQMALYFFAKVKENKKILRIYISFVFEMFEMFLLFRHLSTR